MNRTTATLLAVTAAGWTSTAAWGAPAPARPAVPAAVAAAPADTNLTAVTVTGLVQTETVTLTKANGQTRKLAHYFLVTLEGERWAVVAIDARLFLARVIGDTVQITGLACAHQIRQVTAMKRLTPAPSNDEESVTNVVPRTLAATNAPPRAGGEPNLPTSNRPTRR